jgi:hypothetical protein
MATGSPSGGAFRLSSASVPLGGLTFLAGIGIAIAYVLGRLGVIDRLDLSWFLLGVVSIACGYQAVFAIPHLTEQLRALHKDHAARLGELERRVQADRPPPGGARHAEPGAAADPAS